MKITNWRDKLLTCAMVAVVVAVMALFHIPCPIKSLLHIPCPGCGMTRACLSVLRLDFGAAFAYHPMFWSTPLLALLYLFGGKLFRKPWLNTLLLVMLGAGFAASWIFKLVTL